MINIHGLTWDTADPVLKKDYDKVFQKFNITEKKQKPNLIKPDHSQPCWWKLDDVFWIFNMIVRE